MLSIKDLGPIILSLKQENINGRDQFRWVRKQRESFVPTLPNMWEDLLSFRNIWKVILVYIPYVNASLKVLSWHLVEGTSASFSSVHLQYQIVYIPCGVLVTIKIPLTFEMWYMQTRTRIDIISSLQTPLYFRLYCFFLLKNTEGPSIEGRRKKRIFYGQADHKWGGGASPLSPDHP